MKNGDLLSFFVPVMMFAVIFIFDRREVAMYLASVSRAKYYMYKTLKSMVHLSAIMNTQSFLTTLLQEKVIHLVMKK